MHRQILIDALRLAVHSSRRNKNFYIRLQTLITACKQLITE